MMIFAKQHQKGFTLVELAIVMIIIGLLIGGVLKGQELIANAQVTSTVAQIKGIDVAASTFRDQYQALAGDFSRATVRLPNCTAPCENGNGNARLTSGPQEVSVNSGENIQFWLHVNKADLFSGVNGTTQASWGEGMPAADVGGGFGIGFIETSPGPVTVRAGHWLVLKPTATAAVSGDGFLRASVAARLDRKMDDGAPNGGTVLAVGGTGASGCRESTLSTAQYNEGADIAACALYIRLP